MPFSLGSMGLYSLSQTTSQKAGLETLLLDPFFHPCQHRKLQVDPVGPASSSNTTSCIFLLWGLW